MPEAHELRGQGNGAGHFSGPAHIGTDPFPASPSSAPGSADTLAAAIEVAVGDLQTLMAASDPRSRDILEFQVEMLSDPAIRDIGGDRFDTVEDAILGWVSALEAYIADFERSDDDDIRARAMDVIDMRNRVLSVLNGTQQVDFPAGSIFVGRDIAPSLFLAHDWTQGGGIVLCAGSMASHVALLARARGVPMVVSVGPVSLADGVRLMVDGRQGRVLVDPSDADIAEAATQFRAPSDVVPARAADRGNALPLGAFELLVNIGDPSELAGIGPSACAGIGLLRSEFLMSSVADLANEERQYRLYSDMLLWAGQRPVTIRLLDLGGDKVLGGFGENERNPFLGLRGIRLLLAHPDLLRVQARALLRSAVRGNLKVMLPMVTLPSELEDTRRIFVEEAEGLARRHVETHMPSIGMMVEVPAAALMLDTFDAADFFSLGTNDLAQYLTAAARDGTSVAHLYAQAWPALVRLIRETVRLAKAMGKPIGICGDLAGEPDALPALLDCGLIQFSVAPAQLAAIKTALIHAKTGN